MASRRTTRKPRSKPRRTKARPAVTLLRTSERTTFKRCGWQWARNYGDKLQPIREAPALKFGTLVHKALEVRYPPGIKRGPKPAETFEILLLEEEEEFRIRDADQEWSDAMELGVQMLEHYVKVYGRDEEWKVLAAESTFTVPVYPPDWLLSNPPVWLLDDLDPERALFNYVGTMDGVWENRMDGGVRIKDYKTTSGDPVKEATGKLLLDEQGTAYWTWGVDWLIEQGHLRPRKVQQLDGMLYDFLRKAKPDTRPQKSDGQYLNQDGSVSRSQPPPYFHRELVYRDREQTDKARHRAVLEFLDMEAARRGVREVVKSPGMGYPDMQCKACPYFDMCELDEIGAEWQSLRDASMKEWDPYADHEIQEEGKH